MDTVIIDGVDYTKAGVLAKEFQYTTDYIGQLCRKGKVDAQLVGRSWYVAQASLAKYSKKRITALRQDEIVLENKNNHKPTLIASPLSKHTKKMLIKPNQRQFISRQVPTIKYQSDTVDLSPLIPSKCISPQDPPTTSVFKVAPTNNLVSVTTQNSSFINQPNTNLSKPIPKTTTPIATIVVKNDSKPFILASKPASTKCVDNNHPPANSQLTIASSQHLTTKIPSFAPNSIQANSTTHFFPYYLTANLLWLTGLIFLLTTVLLDIEFKYEGAITTVDFSFNQSAFSVFSE